jgi:hypothetical protein
MVTVDTVLRGIAHGIREQGSSTLPMSELTFATIELDNRGQHADLEPPIVELTPVDHARNIRHNTDFCGYVTNTDGERVGRRYRANFTMDITVDVVTAARSDHDDRELASEIRDALWYYDSAMLSNPLPDPDTADASLTDVSHLTVVDGEPDNDFGMSPTARRSRILLTTRFNETVSTVDYDGKADPITDVEMPGDNPPITGSDSTTDDTGSPAIVLEY